MDFHWDGLDGVWDAFRKAQEAAEKGASTAATLMAKAVEGEAKRSIQGRPYTRTVSASGKVSYRRTTPAVNGAPPQNMTGNLRRSITSTKASKTGFGEYTAEARAGMIYARSLELGKQGSSITHPFMNPAYDRLKANGTLNRIFEQSMKRFL